MRKNTRCFLAIVAVGVALMTPIRMAFANSEVSHSTDKDKSFDQLSAEFWQWALSIPTGENPLLDTNGDNSMIGQHGPVWFLAGLFGQGTVARTCSVPEGKSLYFPVINNVILNSPNVCGQGASMSVKELRAVIAPYIDAAANLSVTVDGVPIKDVRRVKSEVFAAALPKDNVFVAPCGGDSPEGIYSPAVDDGFYVSLKPLSVGPHAIHFHAESPAGTIVQDVTYNITVVPVKLK